MEKRIRETGDFIDDGLHEIFVNTKVKDGTDISELMDCFVEKKVRNPKFPALSAEVTRLKETEGGAQAMCEVMEKYEKQAVMAERVERIQYMINKGCSKDFILEVGGYSEEEYTEAERQMLQFV